MFGTFENTMTMTRGQQLHFTPHQRPDGDGRRDTSQCEHADSPASPEERAAGSRHDRKPRLLVVDDDTAIRETLRALLEEEGYTVAEAADGHAALRRLRATRSPCVVLLDMMMPQLDGAGVLREVALDPHLAHRCAFIVMTADTQTIFLRHGRLLTLLDAPVLRKPFDLDELLSTVEQAANQFGPARARVTAPLPDVDDERTESSG